MRGDMLLKNIKMKKAKRCEGVNQYGYRCGKMTKYKYCLSHIPFLSKQLFYSTLTGKTAYPDRLNIKNLNQDYVRNLPEKKRKELLDKYYSWIKEERKKGRIIQHRDASRDNKKLKKNLESN